MFELFNCNNVECVHCSFQAVVRDLRHLAVKYASDRKDGAKFQALSNAAKTCVSLPRKELEASIKVVAVDVHDVYVQRTEERGTVRYCKFENGTEYHFDNDRSSVLINLLSPCRNVIIKLFREKEPNVTIKKQEILDNAVRILKREVSDKEYHQVCLKLTIANFALVLHNNSLYSSIKPIYSIAIWY
jgi:DNA-directed RNA polymerase-3 subunit RPC5